MSPEEFFRIRVARSEERRAKLASKPKRPPTEAAKVRQRVANLKGHHARREARDTAAGPKPSHCPICLDPFGTGQKIPVWDHCHQGGHFRAWICSACNKGLGVFKDDPERLRRAAAYLELDRARNPLPPVLSDPSFKRKI